MAENLARKLKSAAAAYEDDRALEISSTEKYGRNRNMLPKSNADLSATLLVQPTKKTELDAKTENLNNRRTLPKTLLSVAE